MANGEHTISQAAETVSLTEVIVEVLRTRKEYQKARATLIDILVEARDHQGTVSVSGEVEHVFYRGTTVDQCSGQTRSGLIYRAPIGNEVHVAGTFSVSDLGEHNVMLTRSDKDEEIYYDVLIDTLEPLPVDE